MTGVQAQAGETPVLRTAGISKSFGPVEVLRGIDIEVRSGEVHAIIGENGAGKSTLMKLLAGHLEPSRGEILLDGEPVRFAGPVDSEHRGIVLVHQEILLAPDLTVAQNIYLGRELEKGIILDDRAMNEGAHRAVRNLGADIDPGVVVGRLSVAQRQLVQIARALLVPHRVVIFDEPTASLTPIETEALLRVIDQIRRSGVAVLYISHRLPEVKSIADRVTILRDGKLVATHPASALEPVDMARLMVGRDVSKLYPDRNAGAARDAVLEVQDFTVPGFAENASFTLGRGEILGFAGLVGAGRTELLEGVVGLRSGHGSVRLSGQSTRFADVHDSMKAGIVYLSEDRKGKGLLLQQDLRVNLTLASLGRFMRGITIDRGRERAALEKAAKEFDIRAGRKEMLAGQLSGGNQQKLLLAKMMMLDPEIVIIDEPTRGIDIGTKEQIYKFIAALSESGKSVIVISSEMQELIGICDRIVVMRGGRLVGEVTGEHMTENEIVVLATGATAREAALVAGSMMADMAAASHKTRKSWKDVDLRAVAPFVALLLLLVLGTLSSPNFLSIDNLLNVLTRSAFIAIIAVGATFVISAGGLDLSVGSMVAFVASLMIMFMNSGVIANPLMMLIAAMALAILLGAACGLANGLITTVGRIEPFIATLGTMGIFRGLTTWLSQGGAITLQSSDLQNIYHPAYFGAVLGVPVPIIVIFVTAAIGAFVLYRTRYGRHVIAVGSNEDVARYSGIPVNRVRTITYIVQGLCVAVAVLLYVPRLGSTSATTGTLWELQAITAVVVGGTALRGGVGRIWGTICGAFILEIVGNIMLLSNFVSEYLIGAIQGAIIIIAMLVQLFLQRRS